MQQATLPPLLTWAWLYACAILMCQKELPSGQRGTTKENFSAGFSSGSSCYSPPAGGGNWEEASKSTLSVWSLAILENCHHIAMIATYVCMKGRRGSTFCQRGKSFGLVPVAQSQCHSCKKPHCQTGTPLPEQIHFLSHLGVHRILLQHKEYIPIRHNTYGLPCSQLLHRFYSEKQKQHSIYLGIPIYLPLSSRTVSCLVLPVPAKRQNL